MNHTPGPWEVSKLASPDYAPQFAIYAGPGPSVAQVINGNSEANAKLIAAAPDLLDALRWLNTCANPNSDGGIDIKDLEHAIDNAQQAIFKATGNAS